MYTSPSNLMRTYIGEEGDLDEGALATLLKVVTGVDDLARAVANPGRAVLQGSMPAFDSQGLVDRPGRRDPGTLHILGVDDNGGRGTAAEDSRPVTRGNKGKHPRAYIPQPSSSSSMSPPR